MFYRLCSYGDWGSLGTFGAWEATAEVYPFLDLERLFHRRVTCFMARSDYIPKGRKR